MRCRLGDEIVLRFPLQPSPTADVPAALVLEQVHARLVATQVPLPVPVPVALGEPGEGYRGPWTAYGWIPGETANSQTIGDPDVFAPTSPGWSARCT